MRRPRLSHRPFTSGHSWLPAISPIHRPFPDLPAIHSYRPRAPSFKAISDQFHLGWRFSDSRWIRPAQVIIKSTWTTFAGPRLKSLWTNIKCACHDIFLNLALGSSEGSELLWTAVVVKSVHLSCIQYWLFLVKKNVHESNWDEMIIFYLRLSFICITWNFVEHTHKYS